MRTNNMSLCSTKSWVHVQSEKKEKEVRVLKYFKVKNDGKWVLMSRGINSQE